MTYATYMPAETVDETANSTDMPLDGAYLSGIAGQGSNPTRALVILWFVALGIYWALGTGLRKRLG